MKLSIIQGDVFDELPKLPSESVDLCITSPPYWGLRDYGVEGQLGAEPTMEAYLDNMMRWVKEVWRILKPTGSFVLNIGDCFIGGGRGSADHKQSKTTIMPSVNASVPIPPKWNKMGGFYKSKQFLSVSSFAYCRIISETDFVCRGEHIWAKPNVPSPFRCRLKHSHEKLFWFVKDADEYYFDPKAWMKKILYYNTGGGLPPWGKKISREKVPKRYRYKTTETIENSWRIILAGEKQKGFENYEKPAQTHVAPFPTALIRPYIQSLCPVDGTVLDPFLGSGTTMRVAMEEKRSCIGIDLNAEYLDYAKKRCNWNNGIGVEYKEEVR